MPSTPQNDQVELSAVHVLPAGDGFVLELRDGAQAPLRLQFPVWALHQLMRALPRVDAALHRAQGTASTAILAYPVADWSVDCVGPGHGVAMCLRTDREVESGFAFDVDAAVELHQALGDAIARAGPGFRADRRR